MFENLKAVYAIVRAIFCVILTFIYVPVRGNGVTSVNEGAPVRTVYTHQNTHTRAHTFTSRNCLKADKILIAIGNVHIFPSLFLAHSLPILRRVLGICVCG